MKIQCSLLVALCVLLVGSAIAQNDFTQKMTANVPFDFVVNGTNFPKGEYLVRAPMDGHRLLIQNNTRPEYATYLTNTDIPLPAHKLHGRTEMVFAVTNGQHVLHQICLAGDNHTHDIIHGSDVIELVPTR